MTDSESTRIKPKNDTTQIIMLFIFIEFVLAAGARIYLHIPILHSIIYRCPFKALTHLPCPTCGSTRMLLALVQGQFWQAFLYNPFVFLLFMLPFFGVVFLGAEKIKWIRAIFTYQRLKIRRSYIVIIIGVLFLINWIYLIVTKV